MYGGELLVLWLNKIINRIVSLEEVPNCLKKGIVVPVYKRQGKDPLLLSSYCGITLLSVPEITLLQRLSPLLSSHGSPDQLETTYQKGISCVDAIFATQQTLANQLRDGGKPYLF